MTKSSKPSRRSDSKSETSTKTQATAKPAVTKVKSPIKNRQSLNRLYHRGGSISSLPADDRAATVSLQGQHARLLSVGLAPALREEDEHRLTFSQTLAALPASSSWAFHEIALPPDLSPIIASLRDGSARAVSDGSFKDKFGTSAFTIVDAHVCSIIGLNLVPGHPDDQSAYRSELAGLFAIVLIVNLICSWADIQAGGIEVGCDGLSALNKAFDTCPLETPGPQFDLLSALCTMISASPVTWTARHVPGHQDDDPSAKLDWWATKNIEMEPCDGR